MKSIYNYLIGSISLVATLLVVISCSSEYEYKTDYSSYKNTKLKVDLVDENNTLHLKMANGTHQITVGLTPDDMMIDLKAYIYKTSDENIATVDESGVLTMKGVGETELSIKFRGNQEIATSCIVSVTRDPILISNLKVPSSAQVQEHKTLNLAELITILPGTADNQVLNYESADESIAQVDGKGIVTGISEGNTTIIVSTTDGSNITKEIPLAVLGEIKVSEIKLNQVAKLSGKTVGLGQVFNIGSAVEVMPANASNKVLAYTIISGNGVVSIDDNGVLKTLAAGTAKIKVAATDESGIEEEVTLTVDPSKTLFERVMWTVDTSITYSNGKNYTPDTKTNSGNPEHMFDGLTNTFLSLVKPGKTYEGCKADPVGTPVFFVVDMLSPNKFNYFKWAHRSDNTIDYLRVWGITLFGSNDGKNFTVIKEDIDIPYKNNTDIIEITIPESEYRYIKVQYTKWNSSNGSTMQVAEFNVGKR